jgi:gliding motility-associated-like protein
MLKKLHFIFIFFILGTPAIAQVNFSNGLKAYYPFNGTFNDASGNGNHGTGQNGVTYGTDQWGNPNSAASFDGIDDYISVAASPSISPGHQFTISFRFKTTSSALQVLVSKSQYLGAGRPDEFQYQVGINGGSVLPNNQLFFASSHTNTCFTSSALATNYSYGSLTANNQWYCVVVTFDNGVKKVFMNGTLISTLTISGTSNNTSIDSCSAGTLRFGTWWKADPCYFNGLMDEVRIWNRSINQQEIDSLCNLAVLPPTSDTVINKCAAITGRGMCDNSFTVDDATGFAVNDTVLMIQMKGASIDSSNTASFGTILANNNAGNYEYNVVSAVSGNRISLRYKLQRAYDIPNGKVQFVRVPSFANYTINKQHTCPPWNGTKGGVFALRVAGTLTLNKPIDVSGKGFRGGQINSATSYSCDHSDFYYPASGNDGGMKGEGIAEVSAGRARGKGNLANGGGGGNNTNAGGGGGSNAGAGGIGGHQWVNCNTTMAEGGIGGVALSNSAAINRLYLGGGGGAGHENNGDTDPAGNGGGIILIQAGTLAGNGAFIKSNGDNCVDANALNPATSGGDGQSGGGAGGTIFFRVNSFSSAPAVQARGGNGGNVYTTALHGPGGGGGGGAVLFSSATLTAANISTTAGSNGTVINAGNSAHFAQAGQSGTTISSAPYNFPTVNYQPNVLNITFSDSVVSCLGRQLNPKIGTSSTGVSSLEWQVIDKVSKLWTPVFDFPHVGTYNVKLIVTDSNGCKDSMVKPITITFSGFAHATGDTSVCEGVPVPLSASGGSSYLWSPSSTLSDPKKPVTTAKPKQTTSYVVTVTDSTGCVDRDTVIVTITPGPEVNAYADGFAISCDNKSVQLHAQGAATYSWSPAQYCDDANSANPMVTPAQTTVFTLTGTDAFGCSSTDTIKVIAAKDLEVYIPSAFTPNGDGRNDWFHPIAYCDFEVVEFRVFNRWGQDVFYGHSNKHWWNGKQNGQPAPAGVYYYFVRGKKPSTGEELFYKGDVTLIR